MITEELQLQQEKENQEENEEEEEREITGIFDSNDENDQNSSSSISPLPSSSSSLNIEKFFENLSYCSNLKELGNNAFKDNNYHLAKQYYEEAIELLKQHKDIKYDYNNPLQEQQQQEEEGKNYEDNNNNNGNNKKKNDKITKVKYEEFKTLYTSLHGNKSMVLFKEENWIQVITSTEEVLKEEPDNIKALYRRAVAHHRSGNYEESKHGLNRVLELDSSNTAAKKELNELIKTIKEHKQKEKNAMSSMFSKGSIYNDREEERQRKIKKAKEAEEKLHDEYIQEKLKKRNEGLSDSEVDISFEAWKADKKKKEEEQKKKDEEKRKEEERKKRNSENKTRKKPRTTSTTTNSDSSNGLEYDEEDSKIINETTSRGYCYFKRQLPTEESKLIGDITPKAVTPSTIASNGTSPSLSTTTSTLTSNNAENNGSTTIEASSWNHAGTWEERDTTTYVKDKLKSLCLSTSVNIPLHQSSTTSTTSSLPDNNLSDAINSMNITSTTSIPVLKGVITEVESCDGEAQIVLTRGKKCHLYDFNLKLKLEISLEENSLIEEKKSQKYKATLEIRDIGPNLSYEWSLTFKKSNITEQIRNCGNKLREEIFRKLQLFDREYCEM